MDESDKLKGKDWRASGFSPLGEREIAKPKNRPDYVPGEVFDATLDDLALNRVLILKNLAMAPQGNDVGKLYYDPVNKKIKIWIGGNAKWGDIVYTTTSTSTTSSSTSTT